MITADDSEAPERPASAGPLPARHGRQPIRSLWAALLARVGAIVAVVAVSAIALVGIQAVSLISRVDTVDIPGSTAGGELPGVGQTEGGFTILLVGVDTSKGEAAFGQRPDSQLNDVNILVHFSSDQTAVTAISLPRDMIVPIPACEQPGGGTSSAMSAQPLNSAWAVGGDKEGGLACIVATVTDLTDMPVDYAAMVDFSGFIGVTDIIGGVPICITGGDLYDPRAATDEGPLSLSEGEHLVQGQKALAYLRSRYGVGDGGDLTRISSQQAFLASLIRKVKSEDILSDPGKLYQLTNLAVDTMQLSSNLVSPDTMISLLRVLSNVDLDRIALVTYPGSDSRDDPGKIVPDKVAAEEMFDALRAESAVIPGADSPGAVVEPTAPAEGDGDTESTDPPTPGSVELPGNVRGQLAEQVSCSVANR